MIINPCMDERATNVIVGSRMLADPLGLIGVTVMDPPYPRHTWMVTAVFAPIEGRRLGGIRVRVRDTRRDVAGFINQRDLEVMLGLADPGHGCLWMGRSEYYADPSTPAWMGVCMDVSDMQDDMHLREWTIRNDLHRTEGSDIMPVGLETRRRLWLGAGDVRDQVIYVYQDRLDEYGEPNRDWDRVEERWRHVGWETVSLATL